MATLVCFHAHPDDEAISTGGLMAKAAAAGHRVVLVAATAGELGEPQPGVLEPGETLAARRVRELADAAAILGAEPPRLLGYHDSGMVGETTNDDPACFWQADIEGAAAKLAAILAEVGADVLTVYDDHGTYGHPDHIQVHRVGHRAAELAGTPHVYEVTPNRDEVRRSMETAGEMASVERADDVPTAAEMADFGTPEVDLAYAVDVRAHVVAKRAAMAAHRSQIGPDSFFLQIPDDAFSQWFGTEWFACRDRPSTGGPQLVGLLPGLQ
jgi:LmbE family N-acetylglucosaminyl deacetylase